MRLWHRNSSLVSWYRCPLTTWASYYAPQLEEGWSLDTTDQEDRSPWERFEPFDRGRASHAGLQAVLEDHMAGRESDLHAIVREVCRGASAYVEAEVMDLLVPFVASLKADPVRVEWVVAIEDLMRVEIEGRRFLFRGDVVEVNTDQRHPYADVRLTDWKTNWRVQSQTDFEKDPQMLRYAVGLLEKYPRAPRFILRKRFVRYPGVVREVILEPDDLRWVREDMLARMTEIDETVHLLAVDGERPDPVGGDWCESCGMRSRCPLVREWKERYPEVPMADYPDTEADATKLMEQVVALRAYANDGAAKVRAFADRENLYAIESADGHYAWQRKSRRVAPPWGRMEGALEAQGEDAGRVLSCCRLDLKEWDKRRDELPTVTRGIVDELIEHDVSTEWRWKLGAPPQPALLAERNPDGEPVQEQPKPKRKAARKAPAEPVPDAEPDVAPAAAPAILEAAARAQRVTRCIGCGEVVGNPARLFCPECQPDDPDLED